MPKGTTTRKDLLTEIAGLRAQLTDAQRTIHELRDRCASGPAGENLPGAGSRLVSVGECVALGADGKRTAQAQECFRFHYAFAHAKAAMAIMDADGRITHQNAAHRGLLGYSDEELKGKTPGHYLEGGLEAFGQAMDDLFQRGSYGGEARCRSSKGRCVNVELSLAIIRNVGGDVDGYTVFMLDVTEKKRIEDKLRESEQRFAAFMNNSSVVALMRDTSGRYVYVNRAYEKLVGKSSSEILGRTSYEIWPPEVAKELANADQKVLSAGHAMELHETTALPGGEAKEWLAIKFPFRDRRGNVFVGGVSIDITERKSLEEQLRQSQKMEAVGRLAGGIAHDFNNLLTIITGYSELLLGSREIEEQQKSKLEEIRKAGERAALLTRQLLAFSRKQVLAPRVLDLNTVVENLRKMIERLIGEDVDFITIPQTPLHMVKVDPGQVEQIIMNLVVNARDAMPNGGKLTIETANVEFDEEYSHSHLPSVPGNYVMIAVSDTGTGIDPETQKHIFEPFFTTKEPGTGTGLGLATVYGIVKQSGGFIWVYSEPEVGSVFKIYFPCVLEKKESQPETRQEPARFHGTETILVAEDEEALRLLIRETLERHGYTVMVASDGKDAARLSERYREPIHLLIADVVMPQMSGRQLAEQIAASRPETVVLYISGYTDDAIIHHGVIDPNTVFLQKPFSPASLVRKVWLLLNQRSGERS